MKIIEKVPASKQIATAHINLASPRKAALPKRPQLKADHNASQLQQFSAKKNKRSAGGGSSTHHTISAQRSLIVNFKSPRTNKIGNNAEAQISLHRTMQKNRGNARGLQVQDSTIGASSGRSSAGDQSYRKQGHRIGKAQAITNNDLQQFTEISLDADGKEKDGGTAGRQTDQQRASKKSPPLA